jgi:hypothetical protein
VVNVTPRYAKLLDSAGEVFGWENMELISGAAAAAAAAAAGVCGSAGDAQLPRPACGAGRARVEQRPPPPVAPGPAAAPRAADRPFEVMLEELARLKAEFPDRVLIASIMEEYNRCDEGGGAKKC